MTTESIPKRNVLLIYVFLWSEKFGDSLYMKEGNAVNYKVLLIIIYNKTQKPYICMAFVMKRGIRRSLFFLWFWA